MPDPGRAGTAAAYYVVLPLLYHARYETRGAAAAPHVPREHVKNYSTKTVTITYITYSDNSAARMMVPAVLLASCWDKKRE